MLLVPAPCFTWDSAWWARFRIKLEWHLWCPYFSSLPSRKFLINNNGIPVRWRVTLPKCMKVWNKLEFIFSGEFAFTCLQCSRMLCLGCVLFGQGCVCVCVCVCVWMCVCMHVWTSEVENKTLIGLAVASYCMKTDSLSNHHVLVFLTLLTGDMYCHKSETEQGPEHLCRINKHRS